ncbi:MAG: MFS transporter [Betaproteobacteria bacterium]|nr:MFS transporter [Betaproteobacteria bacterium]
MSPQELRAALSLSSIFGLRMLGMFVILPVFAIYAESLPGGDSLTLVGIALGIYGLTQAILQIPFGWWSDRYGRKPVIYIGLAIFAAGSFIAALGVNIWVVILGRLLQGAGAIAAPVMAMTVDLTRDEHRPKAMAMIGSTIGVTFALSLVLSPWLNRMIGVPGIFAMTGVLVLVAMWVVYALVPDAPAPPRRAEARGLEQFATVLRDLQLARLYYGVFALHAVLMALFIAVPLNLRAAGLPVNDHWQVYLPVMTGSFVLMLPAILGARHPGRMKTVFLGAIALCLLAQLAMPWLTGGRWMIALFLLGFFTAFNVLEAQLPTLISKIAPGGSRGLAIGVFTSLQFLGAFVGAAAGGYLYGKWATSGVVILDAVLLVMWLVVAAGTRVPAARATCVYALPALNGARAELLLARLRALPGVHEARVASGERRAYLTVDRDGFDEQNVLNELSASSVQRSAEA